ncbi:MAG: hypothetical protein ACLR78_01970 [Roseburia sp.]
MFWSLEYIAVREIVSQCTDRVSARLCRTYGIGKDIVHRWRKCKKPHHLAIDTDQNAATAYFYQWVPDTGSVMYCMPEKGTTVSLYFPDEDERNAIAVSCIRENGAKCQAMTDTEMKEFRKSDGENNYIFIRKRPD